MGGSSVDLDADPSAIGDDVSFTRIRSTDRHIRGVMDADGIFVSAAAVSQVGRAVDVGSDVVAEHGGVGRVLLYEDAGAGIHDMIGAARSG